MSKKKPEPQPYEVSSSAEYLEKYGLSAETRVPIKLDPERVPEAFRHLIADAELVGESDDAVREDILAKLPEATKQEIEARLDPVRRQLLDWLIEKGNQKDYSPEWSAFTGLIESFA